MPDWYNECPVPLAGDEVYYKIYWVLNTCRPVGFGIAPIPWTAIHQYLEVQNYDEDIKSLITKVIFAFDDAFIEYQNDKTEKTKTKPKITPKSKK